MKNIKETQKNTQIKRKSKNKTKNGKRKHKNTQKTKIFLHDLLRHLHHRRGSLFLHEPEPYHQRKYLRTRRGSRKLCPAVPVRHDAALKHHLHHPGIPLRG